MFVAGGAALHFHTGHRLSIDVDAWFSPVPWLPNDLEVAYRDEDDAVQMLHLDRQHNKTIGLIHPDADEDSAPLELEGIDPGTLEVRLLSPLDLAVSKIGRFGERDRGDIASLAERGLIGARALRRRATEAAQYYVGNKDALKTSIDLACRLVADIEARHAKEKRSGPTTPAPEIGP